MGHAASLMLMLTYMAALHNNSFLLLIFGLPFDRALPWHKLLAVSSIYNSAIHGLAFYLNGRADTMGDAWTSHHILKSSKAYGMEITGWMLLACMIAMSTLALPYMANRYFPFFFRTHVIFATLAGAMALFHGFGSAAWNGYLPISVPGILFWMLDVLIRYCTMNCITSTSKAKLRLISDSQGSADPVVEFSVPNTNNKFSAGQWVFICFPKLGLLHWHPFTISSASKDQDMTLHFICGGRWTRQVASLARRNSEMKVYVEGPYGAPMVDMHGTRFKCFLIISSGLGWTFLRAWKRQLLQDAARGRPVSSIMSIAILKNMYSHLVPEFGGWKCGPVTPPLHTIQLTEEVYLTGHVPKRRLVEDASAQRTEEGLLMAADMPSESTTVDLLSRQSYPAIASSSSSTMHMFPAHNPAPTSHCAAATDSGCQKLKQPTVHHPGSTRDSQEQRATSVPAAVDRSAAALKLSRKSPPPTAWHTSEMETIPDCQASHPTVHNVRHRHPHGTVHASPDVHRRSLDSHHSEASPPSAMKQPVETENDSVTIPLPQEIAWNRSTHNDVSINGEVTPTQPPVSNQIAPVRSSGCTRKYGRPDIEALFDAAAEQAKALGENRVALLICVNDHVLKHCLREVQERQGTQVEFEIHYEAFGF